jgi:DNA polymerase-3 subunit alpha
MVRIAFVDLETIGLPQTKSFYEYYKYDQLDKYARSRIIQIAVKIVEYTEGKGVTVATYDHIIKPVEFKVANTNFHKITQKMAEEQGIEFVTVMDKIKGDLLTCDVFVAHNVLFDKNVLLSELFRYKLHDLVSKVDSMKEFCTSRNCDGITKLQCSHGLKQPKLGELYKFLFKTEPKNLHNALADVNTCIDCFNEMLMREMVIMDSNGVITVSEKYRVRRK